MNARYEVKVEKAKARRDWQYAITDTLTGAVVVRYATEAKADVLCDAMNERLSNE